MSQKSKLEKSEEMLVALTTTDKSFFHTVKTLTLSLINHTLKINLESQRGFSPEPGISILLLL